MESCGEDRCKGKEQTFCMHDKKVQKISDVLTRVPSSDYFD